jgi:hypothetical protein
MAGKGLAIRSNSRSVGVNPVSSRQIVNTVEERGGREMVQVDVPNRPMRKTEVAVWATLTFALAWALFAFMLPRYNDAKVNGSENLQALIYSIPLVGQIVWFGVVIVYSKLRKRREAVRGALIGLGSEIAVLTSLILYSAAGHY